MATKFQNLFVLGRAAGGKSEFLDMLARLSDAERLERMHIGKMRMLDDFVWLWEKFEEDDIWEKIGRGRLHSKRAGQGYILDDSVLFDFLIEKLNREVSAKYLNDSQFYATHTLLIEFARGGEVPYLPALERFDEAILSKSAIIYVEVSREESIRRNEARYQEKLKHSVLAHKTPDEDMQRFYSNDDWADITNGMQDGYLILNDVEVPFVTVHNEPEIKDSKGLALRYAPALARLASLFSTIDR